MGPDSGRIVKPEAQRRATSMQAGSAASMLGEFGHFRYWTLVPLRPLIRLYPIDETVNARAVQFLRSQI